jgi:hypothetical protein
LYLNVLITGDMQQVGAALYGSHFELAIPPSVPARQGAVLCENERGNVYLLQHA